jgi:hypothetical protein
MNILIIWQNIPEDIKIYEVFTQDQDLINRLRRSHHKLVNSVHTSDEDSQMVVELGEWLEANSGVKKTYNSESETSEPIKPQETDLIIVTGFIL